MSRTRTSRTRAAGGALAALLILLGPQALARAGAEPGRQPGPLIGYPTPLELEAPLGGSSPSFEDQVIEIVNQERFDNGQLPPLKRDDLLDLSSELHSTNMGVRDFFAHCDLDTGTNPGQRMTAAGYAWNTWAENIAAGQPNPVAVMNAWMASSGHRANILSTSTRELGIGYFFNSGDQGNVRIDQTGNCQPDLLNQGPFGHYWTQNFGRRNNVYPVVIEREAYQVESREVELYLYGTGFAVDMRIRNENGPFTGWMPFANEVPWTLSAGSGSKEVTAEIRNGAMTVLSASDGILLEDASGEIFLDGFESGDLSVW